MANNTISQIILDTLKELSNSNVVVGLPKRPREKATKVLESNEIEHLTKHIIKITLWPNSTYFNGWIKEIRTSLNNLAIKLSKYSEKKGSFKYVVELWYGDNELMDRINTEHDDAYWEVVEDEMASEYDTVMDDPFNRQLDLKDIGYHIKEEQDPNKGVTFSLWLKGKKIV
jgi:hypothetical protein